MIHLPADHQVLLLWRASTKQAMRLTDLTLPQRRRDFPKK